MDYTETAAARADEAAAAWNRGEWNAAAVGYLKAAEALDRAAQSAPHLTTAATNMRSRCADAIRRRDQQERSQ